MNRLRDLLAAEIEADDARRAVGAIPEVLRRPARRRGVRALGAGPRGAASGAERARAGGRAMTHARDAEPPDPRFPVYDPHPHPLDLLACWLVPGPGGPALERTRPCIREPEPEASL